ncbi:MAG: hypothetical protein WC441_04025 [Patescibacteria group bacterium]
MFSYDSLEKSINKIDNSGTLLEFECFSGINQNKYGTAFIPLAHPEEFTADKKEKDEMAEYFRRKNLVDKYHNEIYKFDTYLPYDKAIELVKDCQPFNPESPSPDFAKKLHAAIESYIKIGDGLSLKFFTAVNSHLDYFHGVDAFFEISDQSDNIAARTTIDIKKYNPEKAIKADLLMVVTETEKEAYEKDDQAYQDRINQEARKIAVKLLDNFTKRAKKN